MNKSDIKSKEQESELGNYVLGNKLNCTITFYGLPIFQII